MAILSPPVLDPTPAPSPWGAGPTPPASAARLLDLLPPHEREGQVTAPAPMLNACASTIASVCVPVRANALFLRRRRRHYGRKRGQYRSAWPITEKLPDVHKSLFSFDDAAGV